MMASSVEQGGEKINDDHDKNRDSLLIYQQCDDTIEIVNCALPEVVALNHASSSGVGRASA